MITFINTFYPSNCCTYHFKCPCSKCYLTYILIYLYFIFYILFTAAMTSTMQSVSYIVLRDPFFALYNFLVCAVKYNYNNNNYYYCHNVIEGRNCQMTQRIKCNNVDNWFYNS